MISELATPYHLHGYYLLPVSLPPPCLPRDYVLCGHVTPQLQSPQHFSPPQNTTQSFSVANQDPRGPAPATSLTLSSNVHMCKYAQAQIHTQTDLPDSVQLPCILARSQQATHTPIQVSDCTLSSICHGPPHKSIGLPPSLPFGHCHIIREAAPHIPQPLPSFVLCTGPPRMVHVSLIISSTRSNLHKGRVGAVFTVGSPVPRTVPGTINRCLLSG